VYSGVNLSGYCRALLVCGHPAATTWEAWVDRRPRRRLALPPLLATERSAGGQRKRDLLEEITLTHNECLCTDCLRATAAEQESRVSFETSPS
jgi:hypothetical protein